MSKAATEEALQTLHTQLAEELAVAIKPEPVLDKDGNLVGHKSNAAAMAVAAKFLKDNGIEVARGTRNKGLEKLIHAIPTTFQDDDDDERLHG